MIVVPTYNERDNLTDLVERFFAETKGLDLLIVDDASPDGTAALGRRLQERFPRLRLLERQGPRGLGRAYLAGMRVGLEDGYDTIGTMDADLSHDPIYLPKMLARSKEADVIVGSRYIKDGGTVNWRLRRILLSWLANRFASRILGVPAHDMTSGFRVYRTDALRRIDLDAITSTGYSFLVEMLYLLHQSGAIVAEIPIVFTDRTMGKSKLGTREIYLGAFRLITMRVAPGRRRRRCR